ncbi:MAG: glycosyltransferase, partial [Chloroflexota bacterium]
VSDIPHQWLFPRMTTIVHHGGAGTTAAALRAGVPSVIVPYFADQPFWARHVHQQGASPPPIPREELDSNTLADHLQEAVNEKSVQHNALSLGKKISKENGVTQAARLIDSYLKVPAGLMRFNP